MRTGELTKRAALLFAAHLYENRTAVVEGSVGELPLAFEYLLAAHRVWGPEPDPEQV